MQTPAVLNIFVLKTNCSPTLKLFTKHKIFFLYKSKKHLPNKQKKTPPIVMRHVPGIFVTVRNVKNISHVSLLIYLQAIIRVYIEFEQNSAYILMS
jgi:hypothetical protein